jgi:ABC-type transport system substrate-binding protein
MIHKHPLTSEWVPWLAKSWELEPWTDPELNIAEGTKITIEFREGVYWHDSTPEQPFEFTAEDAEFSLTYLKDKNAPIPQPHLDGMV